MHSAVDLLTRLTRRDPTFAVIQLLVLVSHPDDEIVGVGGLLPSLPNAWIVQVTDGAPRNLAFARAAGYATRDEYAAARRAESLAALEQAGLPPERLVTLGLVDQEASADMAALSHRIALLYARLQPQVVLTHPFEGGHPDHDATAFAAHAAAALIGRTSGSAPPLLEMASYHLREDRLVFGEFLAEPSTTEAVVVLTDEERERKRRMMECHASQAEMLRNFPLLLERFRVAPAYRFVDGPAGGSAAYDRYDFGLRSERWRALTAEVIRQLELEPACR